MNYTSKTLLSYLASATALVALFATAGIGNGQNKEQPRPEEIQPQPKKKGGIRVASYTPITVKREIQTPSPVKKPGPHIVTVPRVRNGAHPGDPVVYTFSIADFKGCEAVQGDIECREIKDVNATSGFSLSTGDHPKAAVFISGSTLVDSVPFELDYDENGTQMFNVTAVFPSGSHGKMYIVRIVGEGENENGGVQFAGGDILVVE